MVPWLDLWVQQIDIKGAYLNGILKETIYMRQPEGYSDGTDRVCKLNRTLYSLKQAGREWNQQLDLGLQSLQFKWLLSDPCTYIWCQGNKFQIITIWVDDLLIFTTTDNGMWLVKKQIASKWKVKDLGELAKIIGIEITRQWHHPDGSISIFQKQYIESILWKENMECANLVSMPMDCNNLPEPNPDQSVSNCSNLYTWLLGELQYIANCTRPDIIFAIHCLASYTANPSMQHQIMLKSVLKYLVGTRSHGITYQKTTDQQQIVRYVDAGFTNTDKKKSTTGITFITRGGAILWRSKKQTLTALSITEAEYVALAHAGIDAWWLRNLHTELDMPIQSSLPIRSDNLGAISMAKNPYLSPSSRHINLKLHSIQQLVANNTVTPEACHDAEQMANILTKVIPRPKHQQHTSELGIATVWRGVLRGSVEGLRTMWPASHPG